MREIRNSFWLMALGLVIIGLAIPSLVADSETNPFLPPFNEDSLPASATALSMGSSSSYTGSAESSSPAKDVTITENRITLAGGQTGSHMIVFRNDGYVKVITLSGTGVKVFAKQGESWPDNSSFQSDYGKSDLVTSSEPLRLPVTPGTWYFTIIPLGGESRYEMTAVQKESDTISQENSLSTGSFSSSMGAASVSFG